MVESPLAPTRDVEGGYRLDVRNFGPIVRAGIDLRPLTVFIGPAIALDVARTGGEAVQYRIEIGKDGLRFAGRISGIEPLQLQFRGQARQIVSIRCGRRLPGALRGEAT